MLREDPPDLADNGGMVLTQMAGRHERLGHRPFQMRTLVRDQAVAASGPGRVAPVRDDGMGLDRRRESELVQAHEDRRLPLQFVDAGEIRCPAAHNAVGLAGESPAVGINCLST